MAMFHQHTGGKSYYHPLMSQSFPSIPQPEEMKAQLQSLWANSKLAHDFLIKCHVRLVLRIVGFYCTNLSNASLSDDLVSAGLTAVAQTVINVQTQKKRLYDHNITGVIVYAVHRAIRRVLEKSAIVSVPRDSRKRLKKANPDFKPPTCFGYTEHEPPTISTSEVDSGAPLTQGWWNTRKLTSPTLSDIEYRELLDKILLTPRERAIAEMRLNFLRGKPMSDNKIAVELGVSRATVTAIRATIGKRLRDALDDFGG